jgi:hypothetical protein
MAEIREEFPVCSWKPDKPKKAPAEIRFPVVDIEEDWANRLVPHERLLRPGARQECTGERYTIWRLTVSFYNTQEEPGVDGPSVQYPDVVDALTDACKTEETGTLTLSTKGPRRCKAKSFRRRDTAGERDAADVVFEFWEDNEDDAKASDFVQVSAAGRVKPLTDTAVVWSQAEGANSISLADLNELANELEGLATAPSQTVEDMEQKANAIVHAVERVEETFATETEEAAEEGAKLLTDPSSSRVVRQLRVIADAAKSGPLQKAAAGLGATTTVVYQRQVSIFDVAVEVEQPSAELITLNSDGSIPDLMAIAPNTPIKVFDTGQTAA